MVTPHKIFPYPFRIAVPWTYVVIINDNDLAAFRIGRIVEIALAVR